MTKLFSLVLLIAITSHQLSAQTIYIDPATGSNTNPGTMAQPLKTVETLGSISWDVALIKRGTTMTLTDGKTNLKQVQLIGLSNKRIGAYGEGAKPIIQNYWIESNLSWTRLEADAGQQQNVWEHTGSNNSAIWPIGFGELGKVGPQQEFVPITTGSGPGTPDKIWNPAGVPGVFARAKGVPSKKYEWEVNTKGTAMKFWTYSEGNPNDFYGTQYFVSPGGSVFWLENCENIIIEDIRFEYLHGGIMIRSTANKNITIRNIEAWRCYRPVFLQGPAKGSNKWIDRLHLDGYVAKEIYDAAIFGFFNIKNSVIENFDFEDLGLAISLGGIYSGECYAPDGEYLQIRFGHVKNAVYGNYWPDGGGIELDSGSGGVLMYGLLIENCLRAFHDNSGEGTNCYYSNIVRNCYIAYNTSAAVAVCGTNHFNQRVANNTFIEYTKTGITIGEEAGFSDPMKGLRGYSKCSDGFVGIYNNILIGNGAATSVGISTNASTTAQETVESNNLIYRFDKSVQVYIAADDKSSSVVSPATITGQDPLLDSNLMPSENSPVLNKGIQWWTGLNIPDSALVDYNGKSLLIKEKPDMGAVQRSQFPAQVENKNVNDYFKVYPTIFRDIITIETPTLTNLIALYDLAGNKVNSRNNFSGGEIDFSQLSQGMYILSIRSGKQGEFFKIIKE